VYTFIYVGFYFLPDCINRAIGDATLFTRLKRTDQDLALVLVFLITADQIADVITGITVNTALWAVVRSILRQPV